MLPFATRLQNVETSAIREIFKLLGKPGIISLAGGFPDANLFDVEGIREASVKALADNPGAILQYGATEGYEPLREQIAHYMAGKGDKVEPKGLITTTGSQQALDLIGKTMISPGDKVIVEAPTFLATIQCFRLYGADLGGASRRARKAHHRAQTQADLPHSEFRQPQRRDAQLGAPQTCAPAGFSAQSARD
jgi:2-aminoadipate transaminase